MAKAAKREISVVERRLKSGSIFAAGSRALPLAEPDRWAVRWVDTSDTTRNRQWEMQAEKGWVYLEEADISVPLSDLGLRVQDGRVVRGTHGTEVLMKQLKSDYTAIKKMKDAENRKNTFSQRANKAAILAAAGQLEGDGDQAADFLNRAVNSISVTDSRERVSLDE